MDAEAYEEAARIRDLLRQKEAGVHQKLVQFLLKDPAPMLYHNEPIWRDGELVGRVTSGSYGHTVGGAVGLGYVTQPAGTQDTRAVLDGAYEGEAAIKVLKRGMDSAALLARFGQEQRALARLAHPHILEQLAPRV